MTEKEEIVLESVEVAPFKSFSDWYSEEVVVTFETMTHNLWNSWENQCTSIEGDVELVENEDGFYTLEGDTEREVNTENFDSEKVPEPGVYRDKTKEEGENSTETYTVIVPKSFLTPGLCEKYLEKLNQKFDRNFVLNIKEEQKHPIADLKRLKHSFERKNEEIAQQIEEIIEEI